VNPPPHGGGYQESVVTADLESLWSQLVEAVKRASPFRGGYLVSGHPVSFDKGVFVIGYDSEFAGEMSLADNSGTHALIQTKLSELGHPNSQIKFVKADAPPGRARLASTAVPSVAPAVTTPKPATAGTPKPAAAPAKEKSALVPFNKEDFKNDPLILKALEVFKGQIVEVRA
jgi:hypothetical protein